VALAALQVRPAARQAERMAAERMAAQLPVALAALQVRAVARQAERVAAARAVAPPRAPRSACRALTSRLGPTATAAAAGSLLARPRPTVRRFAGRMLRVARVEAARERSCRERLGAVT
jgi:hypothetical protein